MSNSNVVAVGADPAAAGGGQQSVSTGQDVLVNAASIVDGGSATSPYLQGQYYSDMILLQTNIIGNNPNVTSQDPSKLAPEVVAFTADLDTTHNGQDTSVVASATPQQHTDGVATILH
jgi:hypothetical protein